MVLPSRWHRSSCKPDGLPRRSCLVGCPRGTGCCSRGVSRTHSQWQADRASSNPSCRSSHGSCSRRKSCSTYQPQSHSQNASEEKPQGPELKVKSVIGKYGFLAGYLPCRLLPTGELGGARQGSQCIPSSCEASPERAPEFCRPSTGCSSG